MPRRSHTPDEPLPALKRLGRLVRNCRKDAGLTQEELAARIGVSRVTVIRMEMGQNIETVALGRAMEVLGLEMVERA